MIGPKEGVPAQTFTLRNTSGKDVRFTGWMLGGVDSFNPEAVDKSTNTVTGSLRWKERAVYQTEAGKIVCHKLGRSQMRGEVDRGEVLIIDGPTMKRDEMPVSTVPLGSGVRRLSLDDQVAEFFGNDPLAKDLLLDLGIEAVDYID